MRAHLGQIHAHMSQSILEKSETFKQAKAEIDGLKKKGTKVPPCSSTPPTPEEVDGL